MMWPSPQKGRKGKYLSRFNKIVIQGKGPDDKWTRSHWLTENPKIFRLCVNRPPEMSTLFLNIFMRLAFTQYVPFIYSPL